MGFSFFLKKSSFEIPFREIYLPAACNLIRFPILTSRKIVYTFY